jgi:hypothetical protein
MKQILVLMMAIGLVTGCAAIDWSERVGSYTYDQAVLDFGPPDSKETLTDEGWVASWITRVRGRGFEKRILHFGKEGKLISGQEDKRSDR